MSVLTESESLFEQYCGQHGIKIRRITDTGTEALPDYELLDLSPSLIIEIKQFNPNNEEMKLARQLEERGWTDAHDVYGSKPGLRTRKKIDRAIGQLRPYAERGHPTLLVLYDNRKSMGKPWIDPAEIRTGMYGLEQVVIGIPDRLDHPPHIIDKGFGGNRTLTPSMNTSLSAVATLNYWNENQVELIAFHNSYAINPIDPQALASIVGRQFRIAEKVLGEFQKWEEIQV
jgi:hypothetical protein